MRMSIEAAENATLTVVKEAFLSCQNEREIGKLVIAIARATGAMGVLHLISETPGLEVIKQRNAVKEALKLHSKMQDQYLQACLNQQERN